MTGKHVLRIRKTGEMCLQAAYTGNQEEAEEFKKDPGSISGNGDTYGSVSLSVACHIGHGALAVACSRKVVCKIRTKI